MHYYKCAKRKRSHSCNKSVIRKEIIENLIINITLKILDNEETIEYLSEKIITLQKQTLEDDSKKLFLENQKKVIEQNIKNIITAIEQGIITGTTKQRLVELETQLEKINYKLVVENSNKTIQMKKTDIAKFIRKVIKKAPNLMIKQLIDKIILYDDRVEIYYNYTNKRPDEEDHQAFLFYSENLDLTITTNGFLNKEIIKKFHIKLFI